MEGNSAAGRDEAAPRCAARGRGLRCPPLGGDLRARLQSGSGLRFAGRPRSADRFDGRGHERGSAAEHERGGAQPRPRAIEPLRSGAAQLLLLRAGHAGGLAAARCRPRAGGREGAGLCAMPGRCWRCSAPRITDRDSNLHTDSLARGSAAARRAVETAPSSPLAYFSLAQVLFFQRDFPGFRHAAERAVALNSMDGNSIAFVGELIDLCGRRGARPCAGGESQAAQSPPSRMVLVCRLLRRVPPGRRPRCARLRAEDKPAGPLARARCDGRGLRAARETRGGRRKPCGISSGCARTLRPRRARTSRNGGRARIRRAPDRRLGARRGWTCRATSRSGATPARRSRSRSAALLRHERGEGPGVPLRGNGRGNHERPRARRRDPRRVADFGVPGRAPGGGPAGHRQAPFRGADPRGQRADGGRPAACHRAIDRRRERLPALVGALRPKGRGRLCGPGRDRRWASSTPSRPASHRASTRYPLGRSPRTSRPTGAI